MEVVKQDSFKSWMVLCATTYALAMLGAFYGLAGLLNYEFQQSFEQSSANTAWLCMFNSGIVLLLAPVASIVCKKINTQWTTFLGTAVAVSGYVTSAVFVSDFQWLFLTYGLCTGIGLSLVYTASLVSVAQYFTKYRNIAYGILYAGISMGIIVAPPLGQLALEKYCWPGLMLLTGGVMLHMLISGIIMRPPPTPKLRLPPVGQLDYTAEYCEKTSYDMLDKNEFELQDMTFKDTDLVDGDLGSGKNHENTPLSTKDSTASEHDDVFTDGSHNIDNNDVIKRNCYHRSKEERDSSGYVTDETADHSNIISEVEEGCNFYDEFCNESVEGKINAYPPVTEDCSDDDSDRPGQPLLPICRKRAFLPYAFGYALITGVNSGIFIAWPTLVLYDLQRTESDVAKLISMFGFLNLVFRPVYGIITSKLDAFHVTWITNSFPVLALMLAPHVNMTMQYVMLSVYGVLQCSYAPTFGCIVLELVGVRRSGDAFGFINMLTGVTWIVFPVVTGVLFDVTKNSTMGFYTLAAEQAVGALCVFIATLYQRHDKKLQAATQAAAGSSV